MFGVRVLRGRPTAAVVLAGALMAAVAVAPFSRAGAAPSAPTTTAPPPPPPKAWALVDADTGNIIDAGNDRTPLPPASLTKVITALAASNLAPATPITVSDRAAAAPADKLFMKAGLVWSADQLFHTLLISSANDAAVALAEQVSGTVEGFRSVFSRTALGLGMADHPLLVDPAGLDGPDGVEGGNLVSARDLAIAGRALLAVPSLATIVATPVYYFDGPDNVHHRLTNHNKLFLTTYAGAIGIKTGYTKRAGSCLMAAARVGGRTMIAVVLSSANPTVTVKALLDKGFATPDAAETTVDQLPAVDLGALPPPAAAPAGIASPPTAGAAPSSVAAPSSLAAPNSLAASSPPAAADLHRASSPPHTPWLLASGAALAVLVCLALMIGQRHRDRGGRAYASLWSDDDRSAA